MTLKQLAEEAGVRVVKSDKEAWGGEYGYEIADYPSCQFCGLDSEEACYVRWLEQSVGEKAAKAIINLMEKNNA